MAKVKKKKKKKRLRSINFKFEGLDEKTYTLTPKQKLWCDIFLEPGSSKKIASLEVYKIANRHLCRVPVVSLSKNEYRRRLSAENTAYQIGRENLRKPKISNYIDKVLDDEGYTDRVVGLEHFKNIKQDDNLSAKNTAIDMYYKKKSAYAPQEHIITNKLTDEQLNRIIKD